MKYFIAISILIITGCTLNKDFQLDGKKYEIYAPPNTIKISENFYADETEVSNIDYKEYLYWLSRLYGNESTEYKNAVPDTLVWNRELSFGEPFISNYFRHPAYDYYPVVGVNLKQAIDFTNWRTERVVEILLQSKGLITVNDNTDKNNHFTIERYTTGDYKWILKKESIFAPKYKIPNSEEWENIAGIIAGINSELKYGTDSLSNYNRKIMRKYKSLFNTDNYPAWQEVKSKYSRPTGIPNEVRTLSKNVNDLYGIIGNVAELVLNDNILKGGSWKQKIEEIEIDKNEKFIEPTTSIGFRNICTFELLKINGS